MHLWIKVKIGINNVFPFPDERIKENENSYFPWQECKNISGI